MEPAAVGPKALRHFPLPLSGQRDGVAAFSRGRNFLDARLVAHPRTLPSQRNSTDRCRGRCPGPRGADLGAGSSKRCTSPPAGISQRMPSGPLGLPSSRSEPRQHAGGNRALYSHATQSTTVVDWRLEPRPRGASHPRARGTQHVGFRFRPLRHPES